MVEPHYNRQDLVAACVMGRWLLYTVRLPTTMLAA